MNHLGSDECAAPYNELLSSLKDMFFSHLGSVADGSEGKKPGLGSADPLGGVRVAGSVTI